MTKKKVLIVIDMQNDFITGSLANPAAERIVPKIKKYIKEYKGDAIMFTADTHAVNYLETYEGRRLPVEHCIINTPGWEIEKTLLDAAKEKKLPYIIEKKNTFGDPYIGEKLYDFVGYDLEEIEVCGTCTDICVVSNVMFLRAMYPDADIIVHGDLCAGLTPELHDAALKVMGSCQVTVK